MIYFYINKIDNKYYLMDFRPSYDFNAAASNCLMCLLQKSDVTAALEKHISLHGYIAENIFELETLITGCKAFKEKEIDILISKELDEYLAKFSDVDTYTWQIQEQEAKDYSSSDGKYSSEILTIIAKLKGIEVSELVSKILKKSNKHKLKLFDFKSCKDYINKELNNLTTLEDLDNFDSQKEIELYLKESSRIKSVTGVRRED